MIGVGFVLYFFSDWEPAYVFMARRMSMLAD